VIPVEVFPALSYHVTTRIPAPVTVNEIPVWKVPFNLNPENATASYPVIVFPVL
jgi:hypothetical protein